MMRRWSASEIRINALFAFFYSVDVCITPKMLDHQGNDNGNEL
jgi:hypothetical protein